MGVPDGGFPRIDVTDTAKSWSTKVSGHIKTTVPQCVFFEQSEDLLWVKQILTHGVENGDLCITRSTPNDDGTWANADNMTLKVFGHGASFSVNTESGVTRLWIECRADGSGRGTALCHCRYQAGHTYTKDDVTPLYPLGLDGGGSPIAVDLTCCARYTDPAILVVRYSLASDPTPRPHYYQAWNVTDAEGSAGSTSGFPNPLLGGGVAELPYQTVGSQVPEFGGWTFLGKYLYMMTGTTNQGSGKNTFLYSLDLNNPGVGAHSNKTGPDADPREPEGVMIDNRGTTPKVVFGLTNTRPNGDDAVDLWYVNKVLT